MPTARFVGVSLLLAGIAMLVVPLASAQAPKQSGGAGQTKPTPKVYACGGQLTAAADKIITMEAGKAFYRCTVDDAPSTQRRPET